MYLQGVLDHLHNLSQSSFLQDNVSFLYYIYIYIWTRNRRDIDMQACVWVCMHTLKNEGKRKEIYTKVNSSLFSSFFWVKIQPVWTGDWNYWINGKSFCFVWKYLSCFDRSSNSCLFCLRNCWLSTSYLLNHLHDSKTIKLFDSKWSRLKKEIDSCCISLTKILLDNYFNIRCTRTWS